VVLHMLSGIAIDGRFGLTAIGGSAHEAKHLCAAVRPVVDRLCANRAASTAATRTLAKAELLQVPRQGPGPGVASRKELAQSG
jgi:hypothetical protein